MQRNPRGFAVLLLLFFFFQSHVSGTVLVQVAAVDCLCRCHANAIRSHTSQLGLLMFIHNNSHGELAMVSAISLMSHRHPLQSGKSTRNPRFTLATEADAVLTLNVAQTIAGGDKITSFPRIVRLMVTRRRRLLTKTILDNVKMIRIRDYVKCIQQFVFRNTCFYKDF